MKEIAKYQKRCGYRQPETMTVQELSSLVLECNATKRAIAELTEQLKAISQFISEEEDTPELDTQCATLTAKITRLYEKYEAQMNYIQTILQDAKTSLHHQRLFHNGMDRADPQARVNTFMTTNLPFVMPPYGPLCGRLQPPSDQALPPGSLVCFTCIANKTNGWALGIVVDFEGEGVYQLVDAAPSSKSRPFRPKRGNMSVLPQSLPSTVNTNADFRIGESVCALYQMEEGRWTTVISRRGWSAFQNVAGKGISFGIQTKAMRNSGSRSGLSWRNRA
jgi:hypothetical protein